VTISGNATDTGGGAVAGIEISVDGGATWHPASGTNTWQYAWTPGVTGAVNIRTRATDDSLNTETPSAGITVTVSSSVTQAPQTITFNPLPDKTYGDPPFTVAATATSGLVVTFTVSGGACSMVGATVSLTAAGSCTVTAHQAGSSNYTAAADVAQTFSVDQAAQTLTFGPLLDKTIGDPPFTVVATATSGLSTTFTANGDCSILGNTVTLIKAGSCTVTAHQAGNADYQPAPDVAHTFAIQRVKVFLAFISKNG
jgi:hypothetical protein